MASQISTQEAIKKAEHEVATGKGYDGKAAAQMPSAVREHYDRIHHQDGKKN